MDIETINFLRAFCSKIKETIEVCDKFLANEVVREKQNTVVKEKHKGDSLGDNAKKSDIEVRDRLIPLSKWNQYYDYPSISALRSFVFFEDTNGFNSVIRRVGRRVLICEKSFFEWVETQSKTKPNFNKLNFSHKK
jgi:hypothetical protein